MYPDEIQCCQYDEVVMEEKKPDSNRKDNHEKEQKFLTEPIISLRRESRNSSFRNFTQRLIDVAREQN